ncbi:hypothetical protein FB107DRAFT_294676 [Schizophyllum commune]
MPSSPSPPPSSARGRSRLRDKLRIPSLFRRLSRSLTPSVRSGTPPPAQSAPSAASLTSPDTTSPFNTGSSVTPPADSSAISTVVPTDSVAPTIIVRDEPIEDPKTQRWNAAMAECQRRMGVDFLGPETAEFRSEKDVMDYIAGRENMEPDSESKSRWRKLQRGLVPLARVSKIFCDPIADTISDSFPPSKIVFAAVGLIISASIAAHEEFEQITDALEEIKFHLQVIAMVAGHRGQLLSDTSVNLLVQVIIVLSVIAQMRRDGYVGRFCDAVKGNRPLSDALKVLEKTSSRHKAAIGAGTFGIVANIEASDELKEIRQWLGNDAVEPSQTRRMNTLLNYRAKGTCSWLWMNRGFANFLEGHTKILSVEGKGEEFAKLELMKLTASAISHLRTSHTQSGSECVVLAHFFDVAYKSNTGDLDSLLSSFLYQLAAKDHQCMSTLSQAWALSKSNGYFTCYEKLNTLLGMLGSRLRVFLIIDALDEAAKNEHAQVLGALRQLRSCANISILVSTRVPLADEDLQHVAVSIDQVQDNTDIRTTLDIEFSDGGRLYGIAQAETVKEELMMKADGKYVFSSMRWLTLVIEQLRDAVNDPRRLSQLLSTLPFTLEELYGKRLEAIRRDLVDDTKLLFMWILHSNIPLTTLLLSRVLAFNYDARMPAYVPTFVSPNPAAQLYGLLDSTFISITEVQVRIAHASVREFLVTLSPSSPFYTSSDDAVCLMARTSLAYLLAVAKYIHSTDYNDDLLQLWHRSIFVHEGNHYAALEQDIANVLGQIGAACPPEGILLPALRSAVIRGHKPLVLLLLTNGVDVNMPLHDSNDWSYPRALHLAAKHGHSGDCDKDGCTSLHRAAGRGHRGTVSLLLNRGARIAARTEEQETPLMLAACNNHENVVCLLLTKGADIDDCDKDGWTSLHWAVLLGELSTARLLLERGANVNAVSNAYPTPLHIATNLGHIDIIRLLVDHGAALEARDDDGCTPLYHAVDPHTRADDGTTLLDAVGRESSLMRDAERAARVRELLMRAGCTEETGRGPLENGIQPEDTREGAESS